MAGVGEEKRRENSTFCERYGKTLGKNTRPLVEGCLELILSGLDSIPVPSKNGVFTIGDYGTYDGYSSVQLIRDIIHELRKKCGEELAIRVLYEDRERNDFSSLFSLLLDGCTYLQEFSNVYTMVTNTNFYKQVVPDNSCDIIFTSLAIQWLRDPVPQLRNSVFDVTATEEELRPYQQAAAGCWEGFLLLRGRELKPGGLLVVMQLSAEDSFNSKKRPRTRSELTQKTPRVHNHNIYLDAEDTWRELRDRKIITEDEYQTTFAKIIVRTAREVTQPFEEAESPVRRAGLKVVYHDQVLNNCAFKSAWREKLEKDGVDDRQMFAGCIVTAHRVWSESTFRAGLSISRAESEKNAILDELYNVFRRRVAEQDPSSYRSEYFMSRLVVQKNPM